MGRQHIDRQKLIIKERRLAKFATLMDGVIRIPFTRKGFGLDAVLSTIPVIGDAAGLLLTFYALSQAKNIGVPSDKLKPVIKLALYDAVIGLVPVLGTVFDVFVRPSQRTQQIVRDYLQETHGIEEDVHVKHPFLQSSLEKKQQTSTLWRHPFMAWLWLHLPQIGLAAIVMLLGLIIWGGIALLIALVKMVGGG